MRNHVNKLCATKTRDWARNAKMHVGILQLLKTEIDEMMISKLKTSKEFKQRKNEEPAKETLDISYVCKLGS